MPQTDTLHIKLSPEALKFVQDKVASGEFASESDVLNESVEILMDRSEEQARWEREMLEPVDEIETERWIREVGGPRYDSFQANPSSGIPIEQVEKNLEERRQQRARAR